METLRRRLRDAFEAGDLNNLDELAAVLQAYIMAAHTLPAADPTHLEHQLMAEDMKALFKHLTGEHWSKWEAPFSIEEEDEDEDEAGYAPERRPIGFGRR